jgi:4-amino-4-deoxy-L-arabinose transferase-like glycosyltransferase
MLRDGVKPGIVANVRRRAMLVGAESRTSPHRVVGVNRRLCSCAVPPVPPRIKLLVALVLALHAGVLVHTALCNSETYDEPMYLLASRSYWEHFDFSFNREHPPLSKLLIGLPLKLVGLDLLPDYHVAGATQLRFMYEINADPQRTLFLGRLPMIGVGLLLGLYVFRFARLFGGDRVGLVALVAFALTPALTGNTPLAALDLGGAAFAFIALYYLARLRMEPSHHGAVAAGIALGLAQITKFSNLLMIPVYVLIALLDVDIKRPLATFGPALLRMLGVGLVGLTTMFLGYGCEMRTVESVRGQPRYDDDPVARAEGEIFRDPLVRSITKAFGDRPVPMLTFFKGYDDLRREASGEGHASYFRGETSKGRMSAENGDQPPRGWPSFYLVSLAVKTPVGLLVLTAFALLLLPWLPRTRGADAALLLFPAVLLAYFSRAPSQLGIRYILPVLPVLAVLAARAVTFDPTRRPWVLRGAAFTAGIALPAYLCFEFHERGPFEPWMMVAIGVPGAIALLVALGKLSISKAVAGWLVCAAAEVAAQHPHHLFFYNAFAGGPDRGFRIVSVGDDWGQGTAELAELQRERGWGEIAYDYYGTGLPEIYGLKYRSFDGDKTTGLVAVHAIQLTRERCRPSSNPRYAFLDGLEPIARVNSIFVFDVKEP